MKLQNILAPLTDLCLAILGAMFPTIKHIIISPFILFHPLKISRLFMANVWSVLGESVDENGRPVKNELLPQSYGVVLDVGAGHGHTMNYLDKKNVTKYVALEPNTNMHPFIRATASRTGFSESDGSLLILSYGAEQYSLIVSALDGANTVDTLISILTLCSIPFTKETSPQLAINNLVHHVLKPGGQFLWYEHGLSPREDVAWWQRFWTPVWSTVFGGCQLDRTTHLWIETIDVWEEKKSWGKDGEDEENMWWHQVGRFVKAKTN